MATLDELKRRLLAMRERGMLGLDTRGTGLSPQASALLQGLLGTGLFPRPEPRPLPGRPVPPRVLPPEPVPIPDPRLPPLPGDETPVAS